MPVKDIPQIVTGRTGVDPLGTDGLTLVAVPAPRKLRMFFGEMNFPDRFA
jgi:hypothetical protein